MKVKPNLHHSPVVWCKSTRGHHSACITVTYLLYQLGDERRLILHQRELRSAALHAAIRHGVRDGRVGHGHDHRQQGGALSLHTEIPAQGYQVNTSVTQLITLFILLYMLYIIIYWAGGLCLQNKLLVLLGSVADSYLVIVCVQN